jgi:hypothetical protein
MPILLELCASLVEIRALRTKGEAGNVLFCISANSKGRNDREQAHRRPHAREVSDFRKNPITSASPRKKMCGWPISLFLKQVQINPVALLSKA